jgi:hypothetical protein
MATKRITSKYLTSTVVALIRARSPFPIIADALEDAGYDDDNGLSALRRGDLKHAPVAIRDRIFIEAYRALLDEHAPGWEKQFGRQFREWRHFGETISMIDLILVRFACSKNGLRNSNYKTYAGSILIHLLTGLSLSAARKIPKTRVCKIIMIAAEDTSDSDLATKLDRAVDRFRARAIRR